MKRASAVICVLPVAVLALSGPARAQEPAKPAPAAAPEAPPAPPKPTAEHAHLKRAAGVWDATVEMTPAPGQLPAISKGTETVTLVAGGLWLVTDFKTEFGGQPFEGHGVNGYDPAKKKFVGTWVDSWTMAIGTSEGSIDPVTKQETAWMEVADPAGGMSRQRMVTEWKDDDTRVFTIWWPGPDGKEFPGLRIAYKRRK